MALYQANFSIAGVNAADGVLFNLKTAASDRATLREVGFFIQIASSNAPQYGLKRMNAVGTGSITVATPMLCDAADGTASAGLETAWATLRPTVITAAGGRLAAVANTIGNGVIFDFSGPKGLVVPVSAGICGVMLNASGATTGTHCGYVVWEE